MNKKRGYVILWRSIQDSEIWNTDEPFDMRSAWADLIMMAAHECKTFIVNKQPTTIDRGQIYTSVRKLSARWHWSKDRVLRYLRLLEQLQMIRRDATGVRTLITLVNYSVLQDLRDTNEDSDADSGEDTLKDSDAPHTIHYRNNYRIHLERKKSADGVELE